MERKKYEMSDQQLAELLEACKPVPYLVVGGMVPASPQENANRAWKRLGDELGFQWDTAEPLPHDSQKFFTAVPKQNG
jgi:hypothetical protein